MITSLKKMLQLPNFVHITTSIVGDAMDKHYDVITFI